MAFIPIRGLIALLSLIFAGSGVAFAVMSTVDTVDNTDAPEHLALFDANDQGASDTDPLWHSDGNSDSSATPEPGDSPSTTALRTSESASRVDSDDVSGSADTNLPAASPVQTTVRTADTIRPTTITVRPAGTNRSTTTARTAATAAPATTARSATTAAPATTARPTTTLRPTSTTQPATRPAGTSFAGISVSGFTNSNANVSQNGQDGSFRTVCNVSHFNFDDAIVFPGQRAATHLHMYFGNVLADFASTGDSLAAGGDATCQGGPLNRSSYWVPAVLDQGGNVRPAQYMLAYYKRAGDEDVVPYPNGLKMVVGNAMAMSPQPGREQPIDAGIDYKWSCGSPISGSSSQVGRLIPDCAAGDFLTLSVIFPRCSDGRLDSADHKSHMAYPAYYGAPCPSTHPIRHPQLTYNIHWNNNDTNTGGWYLSSDVHGGQTMPGGMTTHADWIGAWHPEVLDIMTSGCFNADHDCKGGTISPSLRLDSPNVRGFSPASIYDRNVAPTAIPFSSFGTGSTYAN